MKRLTDLTAHHYIPDMERPTSISMAVPRTAWDHDLGISSSLRGVWATTYFQTRSWTPRPLVSSLDRIPPSALCSLRWCEVSFPPGGEVVWFTMLTKCRSICCIYFFGAELGRENVTDQNPAGTPCSRGPQGPRGSSDVPRWSPPASWAPLDRLGSPGQRPTPAIDAKPNWTSSYPAGVYMVPRYLLCRYNIICPARLFDERSLAFCRVCRALLDSVAWYVSNQEKPTRK